MSTLTRFLAFIWISFAALGYAAMIPSSAYAAEDAEISEAEMKGKEADDEDEDKVVMKLMPPLNIAVIQQGIVRNHLSYILVLELTELEDQSLIQRKMPLLRSAYVKYLHGLASKRTRAKLDDHAFIQSRLTQITNKILGEERVKGITFDQRVNRAFSS